MEAGVNMIEKIAVAMAKADVSEDTSFEELACAAIEAVRPNGEGALTFAASVEARYDGRDFEALSRADQKRYVERLAATLNAYFDAALSQSHPQSPNTADTP
jgi:hypothetical protein